MKDLINLAIYGLGTLAVIFLLIFGSQFDIVSANAVGVIAILAVVIVPVVIGVLMAKREKKS